MATLLTLASTAFLMGLAGGSHCLAMCAAPCGALVGRGAAGREKGVVSVVGADGEGEVPAAPAAQPVRWRVRAPRAPGPGGLVRRAVAFHAGRLAGYALVGALAALAMDSLAWLTQHAMALRPVWTMAHVAVVAWGLMLMVQARQPPWVEKAGQAVWARVRPLVDAPGGVMAAGALWGLMPCGLLYSALLVAALSGGALQGAVTMALFGMGSGVWLVGGPWAWGRLRTRLNGLRADGGTRVAGALLCAVAGWALWMDLVYKPSMWCR